MSRRRTTHLPVGNHLGQWEDLHFLAIKLYCCQSRVQGVGVTKTTICKFCGIGFDTHELVSSAACFRIPLNPNLVHFVNENGIRPSASLATATGHINPDSPDPAVGLARNQKPIIV